MRGLALTACATALVACSSNPCDGLKEACVAVEIDGEAPRGDRFDVGVHQGATRLFAHVADPHDAEASLPVRFAIILPESLSGSLRIDVSMLSGETLLGAGSGSVSVPPSGQLVKIALRTAGDGFSLFDGFESARDGSADLGSADLSVPDLRLSRTTSFDTAATIPVATNPRSLAIADIDGDTKADVIVSAADPTAYLWTLRGRGDRTFDAPASDPALTSSAFWVGVLRIQPSDPVELLALKGDNSVTRLRRNGSSYQVIQTFSNPAGSAGIQPIAALIADLDGDGLRDVVVSNYHGGTAAGDAYVYRGGTMNMQSTLLAPTILPSLGRISQASYSIAAGSFDSNPGIDLLFVGAEPGDLAIDASELRFARGTGSTMFAPHVPVHADGNDEIYGVLAAQFVPGGAEEVLEVTAQGARLLQGSPSAGYTHGPPIASSPLAYGAIVDDWNGDGVPDFAFASASSSLDGGTQGGSVHVFTSDGTGGFVAFDILAVGDSPYALASGDLDGDDLPEIVTADLTAGTISVLHNTSH
jgi:hypothetical protein